MMIYTKKTYMRKLQNELSKNLDVTYYDIEQLALEEDYNKKLQVINKKTLPVIVTVEDNPNIKAIESSKKESISIFKIIAIGSGLITFLSFIFVVAVLYKSGFNINKLLYPGLSFIVGSIFFTVLKDKYING